MNSYASVDSVDQAKIENDSLSFDAEGEESADELVYDLSKFAQAVIWGTDWTTETIAKQLEKGNIDLNPIFQRRDAWSDIEKSKLIESLMLGFPVPPIILAESKTKKNSFIVIDGKQRLLSIRRFYSKTTDKQFKELNLTERDAFRQLKLRGLDVLTSFNGMTYSDIQSSNIDYINNIDNQAIRTVVIKNWPDESFLYSVFLRLNTGSKKLSPQELRQALHSGEFLTYLDDATAKSNIMQKMLHNSGPDPRMKDIEIALRFLAFKYFAEDYYGNLKLFLDDSCGKFNKTWDTEKFNVDYQFHQLEIAIEFATKIFKPNTPFLRYDKGIPINRFNRAIFEALTYYLSLEEVRGALEDKIIDFRDKFVSINSDLDFSNSVSETTKTVNRVVTRYSKVFEVLKYVIGNNSGLTLPCFSQANGHVVVTSMRL